MLGVLRVSVFSANLNYSLNKQPWSKVLTSVKHLNSENLWFKARLNTTDKCEEHCAQRQSEGFSMRSPSFIMDLL